MPPSLQHLIIYKLSAILLKYLEKLMLEFYKESNLIFGIIMSYYVWQNKEILMTLQKY